MGKHQQDQDTHTADTKGPQSLTRLSSSCNHQTQPHSQNDRSNTTRQIKFNPKTLSDHYTTNQIHPQKSIRVHTRPSPYIRHTLGPEKWFIVQRFPIFGGNFTCITIYAGIQTLTNSLLQRGFLYEGEFVEVPLQTIRKQLGRGVFEIGYIYTHRAQHTNRRHTTYLVCVCVHLLHATSVGINSKTSPKSTV